MCLRHSCDRGAKLKRLLHDLPTFQFCTISPALTRVSIRFHRSSHSNLSVACKNDGSRPGRLDGLHKTLTIHKNLGDLNVLLEVHRRSVRTMQRILGLDERLARTLTQDLILKSIALALESDSN